MVDRCIKWAGWIFLILIMLCPCLLLYYSFPLIKKTSISEIFFSTWDPDNHIFGLYSFIITSFLIGILSTIISFIIGFGVSVNIYLSKSKLLKNFITFMTGIPTVVYAFIGLLVLVPIVRKYTPSPTGLSIFTVVIVLSILILPTIVLYIVETFDTVSLEIRETALSLGATEEQFLKKILIPHSSRGIAISFILGFGRAISDTMVALILSGNSLNTPNSIFSSARALTSHIALLMPGEFDSLEFKSIFFSGLIFIFIMLLLNILIRKFEK